MQRYSIGFRLVVLMFMLILNMYYSKIKRSIRRVFTK